MDGGFVHGSCHSSVALATGSKVPLPDVQIKQSGDVGSILRSDEMIRRDSLNGECPGAERFNNWLPGMIGLVDKIEAISGQRDIDDLHQGTFL